MSERKVKLPAHAKVRNPSLRSRYKKEVLRLIEKAGIGGMWQVRFNDDRQPDHSTASLSWNTDSMCAQFGYNPTAAKLENEPPERSARHEVGHLITAKLEGLAISRFVTDAQIDQASEETARVFERLLS